MWRLTGRLSVVFLDSIAIKGQPLPTQTETALCLTVLAPHWTSYIHHFPIYSSSWLPQGLSGKESTCNAEDAGDRSSIPGLGRSPGGGHGNPLQYSCLENPMDRKTWWATVHRVTKSWIQLKGLSRRALLFLDYELLASKPVFVSSQSALQQ